MHELQERHKDTHTHIRVSRFADGFEGVWLKACIDIVGVHLDHVTLTSVANTAATTRIGKHRIRKLGRSIILPTLNQPVSVFS